MQIVISEPDGPYKASLDPGVMDVEVFQAYTGVIFTSDDGEKIGICHRDGGFEVHYFKEATLERAGFETGWTEFKSGNISTLRQRNDKKIPEENKEI